LEADLLSGDLITVPSRGATEAEIAEAEKALGRKLSSSHRSLLQSWNGLDLDVIRFYGSGSVSSGIRNLTNEQLTEGLSEGDIVIGSDPAGFIYVEEPGGRIRRFDSDGGSQETIASDLDDFLERLVFGDDAAQFAGEAWRGELREAGILK